MNNNINQNAFYAALRNRFKTLFNRYKVNTLADGGTVRSNTVTSDYMKFCQNNRLSESIKFAWLGESGIKTRTSGANTYVSNAYGLPNKNEYGSELITNQADREFTSDTGFWTYNNGTIADGVFHFVNQTNNSAGLSRSNMLDVTKYYKTTFTIKNYVSGKVYVSSVGGINFQGNGTYTTIAKPFSSMISFVSQGAGFTTLDIDDISIIEVLSYNATQATTANQPYLSGNIAPNERYSLNNPNGGSNYLTHPSISFGATDAWSVSMVLNYSGNILSTYNKIAGNQGGSVLTIKDGTGYLAIFNNAQAMLILDTINSFKQTVGKTRIITIACLGNNTINYYVNGILVTTSNSFNTAFTFSQLFNGGWGYFENFHGKIFAHIIRSQALTATEVLNEATYLRTIYPEIESVQIGTQTWATSNFEAICTPQGNIIANVTDNTIWASSQTLYTTTYDARILAGDTVTQATYAAVKAAAMWCHYNNDIAVGAIYGKLYNWFAVKLLQMDIDYYNAANPTTPWGWRVPTQADFTTLSTYLGGDSVSGGKLKKEGLVYWSSPNTGATNESGFSGIPSGTRRLDGTYDAISYWFRLWTVSVYFSPTYSYSNNIYYNSNVIELSQITSNILGYPLRLIK